MGEPAWRRGIAEARFTFEHGGRTVSNVWHVADLSGRRTPAELSACFEPIAFAWAFGYLGHQAPADWMGSDANWVGVVVRALTTFALPDVFSVPFEWLPFPGSSGRGALPANVTAAVGMDCFFGGHMGRSWSFFPWLSAEALDDGAGDRLSGLARAGLRDAYNGVIQSFQDNVDPAQFRLALFHRDGRRSPGSVVYWDPIVADSAIVRSPFVSEIRPRLERHKRRPFIHRDR